MVRRPIRLVVVTFISLAAVAFVAGADQVIDSILPRPVLHDSGVGGAGDRGPKGSGEHASDYLLDDSDGWRAAGPIAAGPGNRPVFISEIIAEYSTAVGRDIPSEITTIRPILGCAPTPPMAGTVIGHVAAGPSGIDLAIRTYNDADLAAEVQILVNVYRNTGTDQPVISNGPSFEVYDVAVTESRKPVYLVLENHSGARIWNIHQASGVQIERVSLLGGTAGGVANLDPLVPVDVLLNDGLTRCGIRPAYPLHPGLLSFQSPQNVVRSPAEAVTRLAEMATPAAAYDIWFRESFGVGAVESRLGWQSGTISLVGAVPEDDAPKAAFAPIDGAKIRTTHEKFFEIPTQLPEGTGFASRVQAIATTFAYGDLKNLRQGVDF